MCASKVSPDAEFYKGKLVKLDSLQIWLPNIIASHLLQMNCKPYGLIQDFFEDKD